MNDTTPPDPVPDPSPTPFGAGIPAEVVEPVRLAPGLAHGPALDVRGQVAPPPAPPRVEVPPHAYFHSAAAVPPPPVAAPVAPQFTPGSPQTGPATTAGAPASAAASFSGAAPASGPTAGSATPPPAAAPVGTAPIPPAPKPSGRWWIGLAHLAYLIPFPPGVLVTAAVWIWRRGRDPLMADQGREALNMQLTFWLAIGLLGLTCVASPLVPFVYVLGAVLCILAAISAAGGERHRYPWVFRFLT